MTKKEHSEVTRLEKLWRGEFGDEYVDRNIKAYQGRETFWKSMISTYDIKNVLEVGCNIGDNLYWLGKIILPHRIYGVDINDKALSLARKELPCTLSLAPLFLSHRHGTRFK